MSSKRKRAQDGFVIAPISFTGMFAVSTFGLFKSALDYVNKSRLESSSQ